MKNYRTIFAVASVVAASTTVSAAPLATKGGYEYDKNMLSDPAALNWNIEQCSHYGITPDAQQKLAKLLQVPPANARHEFCRRILTAYAKGTIPYDDYVQFAEKHVMSANIARALRISDSHAAKPHR
jgi:hypothetical protein